MGDDGVNVSGDLDSIGSLSSGDLGEDRSFISGRELGRTATRRNLSTRLKVLKDSLSSYVLLQYFLRYALYKHFI